VPAGPPGGGLSGGEQQRLSLALSLVGRPEVLFLDEPTAGVDPEGRIVVRDLIAAQRDKGLCVLLTTHELAEAERVADRVVIIDKGRLLAEGTPAELASGTSDGSVRFSTVPGIDTAALAAAIGPGASVGEERPVPTGSAYPPAPRPRPSWPRWPDGWLNAVCRSATCAPASPWEEAYLAITGARAEPVPEPADKRGRRGRGRSAR